MKMHCYYVVEVKSDDLCHYVSGPFSTYHDAFECKREVTQHSVAKDQYRVVDAMVVVI